MTEQNDNTRFINLTEQNDNTRFINLTEGAFNNLTEGANDNNITQTASGNTDSAANNIGGNTPTVQPDNTGGNTPNASDAIIAQQAAQIDALLARTQSLTEQINRLVTMGGVQINDGKANAADTQQNPNANMQPDPIANSSGNLPEGYKSLKDLGAEIGKR